MAEAEREEPTPEPVVSAREFEAVIRRLPVNHLARVIRNWNPGDLGEALAGTTPEAQERVYEAIRHHAEHRVAVARKYLAAASGERAGARERTRIFAYIRKLEREREIQPVLDT